MCKMCKICVMNVWPNVRTARQPNSCEGTHTQDTADCINVAHVTSCVSPTDHTRCAHKSSFLVGQSPAIMEAWQRTPAASSAPQSHRQPLPCPPACQ
eukprot:35983-Prymnesium_polylepis.1